MKKVNSQFSQFLRSKDEREPGWFWIDNEVLDVFGALVGYTGFSVYAALARWSSSADRMAWAYAQSIGSQVGMSDRCVRTHVKHLEQLGLIDVERPASTDFHSANIFKLVDVKRLIRHLVEKKIIATEQRGERLVYTIPSAEDLIAHIAELRKRPLKKAAPKTVGGEAASVGAKRDAVGACTSSRHNKTNSLKTEKKKTGESPLLVKSDSKGSEEMNEQDSPFKVRDNFGKSLLKDCSIAATLSEIDLANQAIDFIARDESVSKIHAMALLRGRIRDAQQAGFVVNGFWFRDGGWKSLQSKAKHRPLTPAEKLARQDDMDEAG